VDLKELSQQDHKLIYSNEINNEKLEVREYQQYRWFTLGGNVIQSVIDLEHTNNLLLPIPQSMLLFLLWKKLPIKLLNLGMGAGSIERHLTKVPKVKVTSVEKYPEVILMAKEYFSLPSRQVIHQVSAENYLSDNEQKYDVILADIFYQQKNPEFLSYSNFYKSLFNSITKNGVVLCNFFVENKQRLIEVLTAINKYFKYIAIIEFKDYKNMVLIFSRAAIPLPKSLLDENYQQKLTSSIDFAPFIEQMHYIPPR